MFHRLNPYARRVRRGIAFLDRVHPGWRNKINPKRLDIASSRDCVLGQLYGDYFRGAVLTDSWMDPEQLGFGTCVSYTLLNHAWQYALAA